MNPALGVTENFRRHLGFDPSGACFVPEIREPVFRCLVIGGNRRHQPRFDSIEVQRETIRNGLTGSANVDGSADGGGKSGEAHETGHRGLREPGDNLDNEVLDGQSKTNQVVDDLEGIGILPPKKIRSKLSL